MGLLDIIFKRKHFTIQNDIPKELNRCVFIFGPHTSNWDFYHGKRCMNSLGVPVRIAIKDVWMKFPFGLIIRPLGGIGIKRGKKGQSQVDMLADLFKHNDDLALVISPEGSRSKRTKWKSGFYYAAKIANVPIVMIKGNYDAGRTLYFGPVIHPSKTSFDETMRIITDFYRDGVAKFPKNFALDERYA